MSEATRYPFDYDTFEKGQTIPAARLEEILGVNRSDPNYSFKLLSLKDRVERELAARDKLWTLSTEKGDLKILTDAEASTYNATESENARRKERRCFARQQAVDVSQLTDDQRSQHERRVEVQGRFIQAQAAVRKQLRIEAHRRDVPGLPPAEVASSHEKVIGGSPD